MSETAVEDKTFLLCRMECARMHMRNSYQLSEIAKSLNLRITIENLKLCRQADVTDVIEVMLLELKKGEDLGFHITGDREKFSRAKEQLRELIRS